MARTLRFTRDAILAATFTIALFAAAQADADDKVQILKDVAYKMGAASEYEQARCKLDLYLPQNAPDFATIVWFHGGALRNGDKAGDIAAAIGRSLARQGIAVASANYRLHPQVEFPAFINDAAAAVAYIQRQIAAHGGSPSRVFVSGHSAGGYLTAMVGVDPKYLAAHDLSPNDIAGFMPVAGQMITHSTVREERGMAKTQPIIDAAAPCYHVHPSAPPFLNIVGGDDLPARAEENGYFVAAMKAAGHKDVVYLEVPGRTHNTIASGIRNDDDVVAKAMKAMIERLKK